MSDIDDFAQGLASMNPAGAEAQPVQAADTTPQQPQEQPQEPAQPAPAEQPAPQPAEAPPLDERVSRELDGRLQATLAERDKRKEAERRAQAAEAEVQRYRAQQQPVQAPSAFDAPDEWAAYQQDQLQRGLLAARFEMSEALARTVHGEAVDSAKDWAMQQANTVPGFADQWVGQVNPLDWAVKQHRQSQLMAKMGDVSDLDQWIEQQAAARGFVKAGAAPAAPLQPTAPTPQPPSRSLASAPSAGGQQVIPANGLASVFPGI